MRDIKYNNSSLSDHTPVMLSEMIEYLKPKDSENFLDCTFGAGGYSKAILGSCNCKVTAVDRDPSVERYVQKIKDDYGDRFNFINSDFIGIEQNIAERFDGIVADLGVSSMQLDQGERGFSFSHDGYLDMRMSSNGMSAADFIASADEQVIADVIYQYGDEPASRRIAKKIVSERKISPINSTLRLAEIVRSAIGFKKGKIDPATKSFQAIRIYINDELEQLKLLLDVALRKLLPNGRLVIVSFHSLEDRIVKDFLKINSPKIVARSKYALIKEDLQSPAKIRIITKRPVTPSREEIMANVRSRSAKLRAAVMIGDAK